MTRLVDPSEIEEIVGAQRHATEHIGRFVTSDQTFYILHSHECVDRGRDLRTCIFSRALDNGLDHEWVEFWPERPMSLRICKDRLRPLV